MVGRLTRNSETLQNDLDQCNAKTESLENDLRKMEEQMAKTEVI